MTQLNVTVTSTAADRFERGQVRVGTVADSVVQAVPAHAF